MRIVSGMAGGIRLAAPSGRDVRPTGDRVKEALFAMLGDLRGATVVDLFAGSGALGLEAWSRGARRVFLIEKTPKHIRTIEENRDAVAAAMGIPPSDDAAPQIVRADVRAAPVRLAALAGQVDLILADPPYQPKKGSLGPAEFLQLDDLARWAGNALLALEHETGTPLPWTPESAWKQLRRRRYGTTTLTFAEPAEPTGTSR